MREVFIPVKRCASSLNADRIDHLYQDSHENGCKFILHLSLPHAGEGEKRVFQVNRISTASSSSGNLPKPRTSWLRTMLWFYRVEAGGLVKVDDQGLAMVEVAARLRGQIAVKEFQMGAMCSIAAVSNPEVRMDEEELASGATWLGDREITLRACAV